MQLNFVLQAVPWKKQVMSTLRSEIAPKTANANTYQGLFDSSGIENSVPIILIVPNFWPLLVASTCVVPKAIYFKRLRLNLMSNVKVIRYPPNFFPWSILDLCKP